MFVLTTKKTMLNTLIFFIIANQHIFAKVTILRGSSSTKNSETVKLICLSEDDGGALVWNPSPILKDYDIKNNFQFHIANGINNDNITCKLNRKETCLKLWTKDNWDLTNSLKTPMGPVFDQRWEEFKQYESDNTFDRVDFNLTTEMKLSFSVCVFRDASILLCNGMNYNGLCYWIIIGGWDNTKSVIRKCENGVPLPGEWPKEVGDCSDAVTLDKHALLSESEWRTFVITWDSETRKIVVYDADAIMLMTYVDTKVRISSNRDYYMFIRRERPIPFRFHIYNFLHTTVESAILTSPIFQFNNDVICVQLLIGLCAECDAHVMLIDVSDNEVLEEITVKGSSKVAIPGLPMWQSVEIKSKSINYSNYWMKIQLNTMLNDKRSLNPLWAIANVRQCPQNGALRKGEMLSVQHCNSQTGDCLWPNVTCQKLFYDEQAVVSSTSRVKSDPNLDDTNCSEGKIGPQCLFSCQNDLNSVYNCMGTKICYVDGCTCASGFLADNCSEPCGSNTYGYNCKKVCGSCLYGTYKEGCNKVTGVCSNGCNNTKDVVYVPPLCQTSVDKLDAPTIISTNETTIYAAVSITWKDEYEKIPILYSFIISGHIKYSQPSWKNLFRNMTQLTERFDDLVPGTTYLVGFSLNIVDVQISSVWQVAETKCNSVKNFDITPQEDGMIIDWRLIPNQLYSCPISWYNLEVRNVDTNEVVVSQVAVLFSHKLQGLPPYTIFDTIILHKDKKLFFKEIRTLEGIPSSVSELGHILTANTLILIWKPPRQPNGEIVRYDVNLKVEKYHGCENVKSTLNKHNIIKFTTEPAIIISDLHPYSLYSAQVRAHNSRHFSMVAETIVNTTQSEIPSEVFSNLTIEGWKLSWRPPTDCTIITGPLYTRIKIHGISDAVKHINIKPISTQRMSCDLLDPKLDLKLNGAERYAARIYVIRSYNSKENASACKKYEFETPPKAPPRVINLEVVEVDTREIPVMIHLRWQSPRPPLNGKLHHYGIRLCDNEDPEMDCSVIEVQLNKSCDLWENYICKEIEKPDMFSRISIEIFAYNANVTEPSSSANVTDEMLHNTTPDALGNYTFKINNNSVIDLKWFHPWKTGDHLRSFHIQIQEISSNLRKENPFSRSLMYELEYPLTQYMRNYSQRLYLFPSTVYNISIKAVTVANKSSNPKFMEIHTPSTATFDGMLYGTVNKSDSTILLDIPHILNDTRDSMMHIIVKGANPCEQYSNVPKSLRAIAGVKMNETAWQAAKVSTSELVGKQFKIGDNRLYGNAKNCLLKSEGLYEIVIIVTERNSSAEPLMLAMIRIGDDKTEFYESWLIPIILFLVVTFGAYYLYRSKKRQEWIRQRIKEEMALVQDIELYEHIPSSWEDSSTISDKSLSRATTPEMPPTAITNDDEENEETITMVKVKDFEDYVRQAIQSGLLVKQYKTFPTGQTRPCVYGDLPPNKYKNRYKNLIAYDETRVILEPLPYVTYSDYINANYITGYKREKRYIAAQGPKPGTVIDFWRIIWQENVLIICMLTNLIEDGKIMCEQYWPDIGKKKKYGDIIVFNAKHDIFADYCFRTFDVTCGEENRKVEHLHYTAWPDHGVPLYTHSVVTYLKKLLATKPGDGPVLVHCSAGTGRTGTIILCDICLHRAAAERMVDVFAEMAFMANERANIMHNSQQYLLAHLVLVECLFSIPTTLPCDNMLITRIKEFKIQLPVQQQRLQNTAWQDKVLRHGISLFPLSERNRAKNRYPELISDKVGRIYLKRYPASDEDSDYLSAVFVDRVKLQNQYLATQLPMPSTINDFWRMIDEFKVELILMLQPPDLQEFTCCVIAPARGEFKPTPYLNITAKKAVEMEYYTSQKLLLVNNSENPPKKQSITILCLTAWKPGKDQPLPPVITMVSLWQAAEKIARGDGPTVTLCHDGVTGCGLYLALSFLLERMTVEKECDVYLAVRAIRRSRPDFVHSLEHLEYLYDAASTYLECFETYANFS